MSERARVLQATQALQSIGVRIEDCVLMEDGKAYLCREIDVAAVRVAEEAGALVEISPSADGPSQVACSEVRSSLPREHGARRLRLQQ